MTREAGPQPVPPERPPGRPGVRLHKREALPPERQGDAVPLAEQPTLAGSTPGPRVPPVPPAPAPPPGAPYSAPPPVAPWPAPHGGPYGPYPLPAGGYPGGYPGWSPPPPPRTSGICTSAMVVGIVSGVLAISVYGLVLSLVLGPVALGLGIAARRRIARGQAEGAGQAAAGFVLGILTTAASWLVLAAVIVFAATR